MKKISILIILLAGITNMSVAQQEIPSPRNSLTIVFYNVENLFDILNDPNTADEEFLPESPKKWDSEKYMKKITDLSLVLSSVNSKELPALIGLAEIENRKTVEDLASSSALKKGKYGIVHFDSKDERGIDVALLYSQDEVELLDSKSILVSFGKDIQDVTRDILYAKCRIKGDNVYHVFVNHWPSRSPNEQDSEIKRIMAAIALRKEVDNILNSDNNARIIIMGDFNDEPTNKSVFQILNATNKRKNVHYRDLFNLMYDLHNTGNEGSITYKENWQMFDQIIVSESVLSKGTDYYATFGDGKVFRTEKVLSKNPASGTISINRTYAGDKYVGGASDHLPVFVIMQRDKK